MSYIVTIQRAFYIQELIMHNTNTQYSSKHCDDGFSTVTRGSKKDGFVLLRAQGFITRMSSAVGNGVLDNRPYVQIIKKESRILGVTTMEVHPNVKEHCVLVV